MRILKWLLAGLVVLAVVVLVGGLLISPTYSVQRSVSISAPAAKIYFTAAQADKRLVYELYFPDFGSTATGALTLQPEGAATRITWSVDGDMGSNPVLRWLALAMDSLVGKDFDAGLANLKALAEKP